MVRVLITNWWLLLLRGVFALGFAIFVFVFQPFVFTRFLKAVAFTGIAELFGVFAAIMGIITILASLRGSQAKHHAWTLLAEGVLLALVGAAVILIPNLGLAEVVRMIAAASLLAGVLEIIAGAHLRRHLTDEWVLILCGLATVAFAGSLFLFVARDVAAVVTSIGVYAGLTGAAMVALALRLRSLRHSVHMLAEHALSAKAR